MVTSRDVKKMDNQVTFAVGYRNLLNIVIMAFGFVMYAGINTGIPFIPTSTTASTGLIIFMLGLISWYAQFRDNIDALSIEDMKREG